MGGSSKAPMAGKMMNEEFASRMAQQRQERLARMRAPADEMFATLQKSGQRPYDPYKSPYEVDMPSYRDFFS